MQFYLRLHTSTYIRHIYDSVSILRAFHFTSDIQQRPVLLPRRRWQNISQDWRAPEKELKGGRVRPSREGESGQSVRRHPVCGLWTKPSSRGTKQESGAQILQTGWPLCLEVYVPQSRTPVEKGHWRRVGLFRLSVSCQCVCIPLTVFTHTRSLFPHVSAHIKHTRLSAARLFSHLLPRLPSVLPICCFCFPLLLWPPSTRSVRLSSRPHVVLHSTPPSFKCWWAAEQYPGGHGDRQPPPCGLFLLLSYRCLAPALY